MNWWRCVALTVIALIVFACLYPFIMVAVGLALSQ